MKKKSIASKVIALLLALSLMPVLPMSFSANDSDWKNLPFESTDSVTNAHFNDGLAKDELEDAPFADTDVVRASIVLDGKSTLEAGFDAKTVATDSKAIAYRNTLREEQNKMTDKISTEVLGGGELDVVWNLTLAANIISVNVEFGKLLTIKDLPGVKDVMIETRYMPAVVEKDEAADPNMATSSEQIGTSFMWSAGFTGVGRRIAIIDTGVDIDHISFDPAALQYSLNSVWVKQGYDSFDDFADEVLMNADDIEPILEELNAYEKGAKDVEQLYRNIKFPFAFNYIDGDYNISHEKDQGSEHGSHVTGIVSANSYIFDETSRSFKKALDTVKVQGVAPDAQILPMKVFGVGGGAYDSDYFAAVEDAIALGCDSANLSLGSAFPGWSNSTGYQALLDKLTKNGLVMVTSAGNNGSAADYTNPWLDLDAGEYQGYLYGDDVSFHTGGNPGSFRNTFAVASVDNAGITGMFLYADGEPVVYNEVIEGSSGTYSNAPFMTLSGAELQYVYIDAAGTDKQFAEIAPLLKGKVAVCNRGETNFASKANEAVKNGAVAVIIVNNQAGVINMDLTDYTGKAPVVSVTMNYRDVFKAGKKETVANGVEVKEYYTGSLKVGDKLDSTLYGDKYYTVSEFSAWGVPQNLTLKPEITAPGGSIYSVNGSHAGDGANIGTHDAYEMMSGTSMAAPQVTGMVALVDQYVSEMGYDEQESLTLRQLALSLLMSTAEPMEEEFEGTNSVGLSHYYYPVLRQGAGLANVGNVLAALSYIMMGEDATESYADGKVKAELGANEDGKFSYSFTINNLDGETHKYTLSSDLFTQDLFELDGQLFLDTYTTPLTAKVTYTVDGKELVPTSSIDADVNKDGVTDSADALAVLKLTIDLIKKDDQNYDITAADVDGDDAITTYDAYLILDSIETPSFDVEADGKVTVKVDIEVDTDTLTDYVNGAYLEGYTFVNPVSGDGEAIDVTHSIPLLGFIGDWSDPSMYDQNSYIDSLYGDDTIPYVNSPAGTLGGRNIYQSNYLSYTDPLGDTYYFMGNPYGIEKTFPADKAAMNSNSKLYQIGFTLIRNAAAMGYIIKDADTDEILFASNPTTYGQYNNSAYFTTSGTWANSAIALTINKKLSSLPSVKAGTTKNVSVSFVAIPELYLTDDILAEKDGEAAFTVTAEEFKQIIPQLGEGAFLTSTFKIDDAAPKLDSVSKNLRNGDLELTVSDNEDIAYIALLTRSGSKVYDDVLAPEVNSDGKVVYAFKAAELGVGSKCTVLVADYAGNESTYTVEYGGEDPDYTGKIFTFVGTQNSYTPEIIDAWVQLDPETLSFNWLTDEYTGIEIDSYADGPVSAAEYVGGYVFFTIGSELYVADVYELGAPQFIADLSSAGITSVFDLAFNTADQKLYALAANNEFYTVDMMTGEADYVFDLEVDGLSNDTVRAFTIDDDGNFYAATYYTLTQPSELVMWSLEDVAEEMVTLDAEDGKELIRTDDDSVVRECGGTMAWDHDNDVLYLASSYYVPNADGYTSGGNHYNYLYTVDTETGGAEPVNTVNGDNNDAHLYFAARGLFVVPSKGVQAPSFKETDKVSSIKISAASVDLLVGGSEKVGCMLTPWTLSDKSVNWTSANPSVAKVDENGVITGVSVGTTKVTATSNADPKKTATVDVTVGAIPSMTLSAIIYDSDELGYHAQFDTSKTEKWTKFEGYEGTENQYLGGTLVNDLLYVYGLDGVLYEIDADTFETKKLGTVDFPIGDAAALPTFVDAGYYFAYAFENWILLGQPYNLEEHNQGTGWSTFETRLTNDNIAVLAYAYTDEFADAADGMGDYLYMMTEKGDLWMLIFFDDGSMSYENIGIVEGVDLTGVAAADGSSYASLAYKKAEDGKEYLVLTSFIEGVDEESAKMQLIDLDEMKVVTTTRFGENVWPVVAEYNYTRLTDLTVLLDKTDISLYEGAKATVNARVKLYKSDKTLKWSTSDDSVATVDDNGVITAVGGGTATITATTVENAKDGKPATASVTVTVIGRKELDTDSSVGAQLGDGKWVEIPLDNPSKYTDLGETTVVFTGGGYDAEDGKLYGSDANVLAPGTDLGTFYWIDPENNFNVHEGSDVNVFYAPVDLTYAPELPVEIGGETYVAFGAPMYIPVDSNTPNSIYWEWLGMEDPGRGMIMLEDIDEGMISGTVNLTTITNTGNMASAVAFGGIGYWANMVAPSTAAQIMDQYETAELSEIFYVINADTLYAIIWIPCLDVAENEETGELETVLTYLMVTATLGQFGAEFPDDTAVSMDMVDIDADGYTDGLVIAYYGDGMPLLFYLDLTVDELKAEFIGTLDAETLSSLFFYSNGAASMFSVEKTEAKISFASDAQVQLATSISTAPKAEVMSAAVDVFDDGVAALTSFKAAKKAAKNEPAGSLNEADVPAPAAENENAKAKITVEVKAEDTTNGRYTLKYDSNVMELVSVNSVYGSTKMFAYNDKTAGVITMSFASLDAVDGLLATVTFVSVSDDHNDEKTEPTLTTEETGKPDPDFEPTTEEIEVTVPGVGHTYGEPTFTWSDDYTTATAVFECECGESTDPIEADVTKVTVDPTCVTAGKTTYTATVTFEGKEYTDTKEVAIPATGEHTYGEPTFNWSKDNNTATAVFECEDCDDEVTVKATVTSEITKEATCAEEGTMTYTATVEFEDETYTDTKDVAIPATGEHTYGEPTFNWSDDNLSAIVVFECETCDSTVEREATVTVEVTDATCAEDGKTTYTATVTFEGKVYTDTKEVAIPATGEHTYGEPTFTWHEDGKSATAAFKCEVCGETVEVEATLTAEDTKAPTCAEDGKTTYTVTVEFEGKTYTATNDVVLPATGEHTYGEPTFKWSEDGTTATAGFECEVCGDVHTETATMTSEVTKAPTCGAEGTTTYTATVEFEGKTYADTNDVAIAATGEHTYGEPTFKWSEDGTTATAEFECEVCGDVHTETATMTSEVTKAPTCTAEGTTTYTATVEFGGKTYTDTKDATIAATGEHTYGEPTFTWSDDNKTATAEFKCDTCGHTEKADAKVTSEVTKAPTCTAEGTTTYTATVEFGGKTYTDTKNATIAATGEHTFENGKCTVCGTEETADAPQTGDASMMSLWFTFMLGMAGLAIAFYDPKKSKKGAK